MGTYGLNELCEQWSKATYAYGEAACLATIGDHDSAAKLMGKVNGLKQRIAGKSIPVEVGLTFHLFQPVPLIPCVLMITVDRNSPLARRASIWLKRTALSYQHSSLLTFSLPLRMRPAGS